MIRVGSGTLREVRFCELDSLGRKVANAWICTDGRRCPRSRQLPWNGLPEGAPRQMEPISSWMDHGVSGEYPPILVRTYWDWPSGPCIHRS